MGSWGITERQSEEGLDLLGTAAKVHLPDSRPMPPATQNGSALLHSHFIHFGPAHQIETGPHKGWVLGVSLHSSLSRGPHSYADHFLL